MPNEAVEKNSRRVEAKTVHVSRAVSDRVALIDKLASPKGVTYLS